jgi:hypothetical protein
MTAQPAAKYPVFMIILLNALFFWGVADLYLRAVGFTPIVPPFDSNGVSRFCSRETELQKWIYGDSLAPVRFYDRFSGMGDTEFLDEMSLHGLPGFGIDAFDNHWMPDDKFHGCHAVLSELSLTSDGICHDFLSPDPLCQPPQPPTLTVMRRVAL